ncbi:hypothetical protein Droror1_Dr00003652, partial [Drosera rotundifolia]
RWVVRTGGAASKGRTTWLDSNGDRVVAFVASRGGVLFSGEFGLFGLVEPGWLNEGEAAVPVAAQGGVSRELRRQRRGFERGENVILVVVS